MSPSRITPAAERFQRDRLTHACYALLALLTLSYGTLGPLIPWLMQSLSLTYVQASYHPMAMSIGVTVTSLIVPSIAARIGRKGCIAIALMTMSTSLTAICAAPTLAVSLAACVLLGAGLPFIVSVAPAVMAERHGRFTAIAMAEANAIAYLGFLSAPAIVSLAAMAGSWRLSFVVPVLIYFGFWIAIRRMDFGAYRFKTPGVRNVPLPFAFWAHWIMLILSISAELALITWSASYLEAVLGLPRPMSIWVSMTFPAGMAIGRVIVSALLRFRDCKSLTLPSMAIGAAGAFIVVAADTLPLTVVGLFVAGLGIAGLYPFGITMALEAAGTATDQAASRASMASGVATLISPWVLGTIADSAGLRTAFSIVPAILAAAALFHLLGRWSTNRKGQTAA